MEQPAGEHSSPLIFGMVEHQQLDKGPGFLRAFPLGGAFAGAQPHDRPTDPDAFARFQRDIADQAIALVQQAEDSNPFRHRRYASERILFARRRTLRTRCWLIIFGRRRRRLSLIGAAPASCQQQQRRTGQQGRSPDHAPSGVHA
jgi:hypothetical protein